MARTIALSEAWRYAYGSMSWHFAEKFRARLPFAAWAPLVCVYALAIAAVVSVIEHWTSKDVTKHEPRWVLVALLLSTAVICYLLQRVLHRVEELHLSNRLDVRFFGSESGPAIAKMYRAAADMFDISHDSASCEIRAVNCFDDPFAHLAKEDEAEHDRYFRALETAAERASYHRILQYDDEAVRGDLSPYLTPAYRRHFVKLIEMGKRSLNNTVKLEKVAPRYPTAYVIIEKKNGPSYLIWQLNEYLEATPTQQPRFRPRGVLLITDPDHQLIRHFKRWFAQLTSSGARAVLLSELGEGDTE